MASAPADHGVRGVRAAVGSSDVGARRRPSRFLEQEEVGTLPRAERAAGIFVAALRVATLVQMVPSLVTAVDVSARPGLCLVTWVLAGLSVTAVATRSLVRRRPPGVGWATADVAVATALLLLGLLTVPVEYRTGSWIGFQSAYSLSVACSLVGVRDRRHWLALLGVLVVARTVYLLPIVTSPADVPTVLGELFTLLGLAPLAWAGTRAVYRIAEDADEAREYAATLAREAEERRARAAIHNGTALMKLLVDHAESGATDSRTPSQLWVQAASELNRMRAYLAGGPASPAGQPQDLAELVEAVAAEFADLSIDVVAELARGVALGPEAPDLATALRSLLINVRQHAAATKVVLHAEEPESGRGWTVTIHDDGVGFDTARTTLGVGLRGLTIDQLATYGISTTIDSMVGLGTTVTLANPGPS